MRIGIWKHPSKAQVRRAYFNDLPFLPAGHKAYVQPFGDGVQLYIDAAYRADLESALMDVGLLSSDAKVEDVPFVAFEQYAASLPAAKGRPSGKKPGSAPGNRAPARSRSGTRLDEANALDLSSIAVPEPITIRIDHREPAELFELLEGLANVNVQRVELALGDIEIQGLNTQYVIERKCCGNSESRTDFEASVVDDSRRLFFQSEKMRLTEGIVPIVLLEGCAHEHSRGMLVQAVDGMLSYLITLQKLNVLSTYSLKHTAYFIVKLGAHDRSGLGYEPPLRGKKPRLQPDQVSFVIEGLPGVSSNLARRLADHFGSLAALVAASDADLGAVPGMGPKRIAMIRDVLHGAPEG